MLKYHVVPNTIGYVNTLEIGTTLTTLQGQYLTVFITDAGDMFINGAGIVYTDPILANGVTHLIDNVLNPDAIVIAPVNGTEDGVPAFGDDDIIASSAAGEDRGAEPTSSADNGEVTGAAATSGADASQSDVAATSAASLSAADTSTSGGATTTHVVSVNSVALAVAPLRTGAVGAVGAAAMFGGAALVFNL
jgi:hypothetical protein